MSRRLAILPRLLAVLGVLTIAALASAASSQAAAPSPWGDLGHFGELETELRHPEAAFGANPTDGSLWAVDVVGEVPSQSFRLQKFEKVGTAWKAVASATLPTAEGTGEATREAQGIAFDAEKERAYVLINNDRAKAPAKGEPAATELLAFKTKTTGGTIEPAAGTKAGGVLVPATETLFTGSPVGKTEFSPNSEKGSALITPGGIAVNPTNHQILITGSTDGKKPAIWAISESGKIETDWEDSANFFEKCGCVNSPVVTSSGKILVLGNELQEITELPSDLGTGTPKRAFWLPRSLECEELEHEKEQGKSVELCPFVEKLTRIEDGTEIGGEMSLGPEGNLYVHLHVQNVVTEGGFEDGGVMVISPSFQEIGWTGGAGWGTGSKECAVNETNPGNLGPALVAGYKENVFMLERGNPIEGEHAKVLQLGPGEGAKTANCPKGVLSEPVAEAGGGPLATFPIADKIAFSSTLQQANALSSEWEFEAGVKQAVNVRQQQKTSVEYRFKKGGTFTVKETVHSDDLASPLIEATKKVTIVTPQVRAETATPKGTSVTLKAEVNPTASPTKCEFQYSKEALTASNGTKVPCPVNPGEEEKWTAESVEQSGLAPGTYHYRLLMKAGEWQSEQPGGEFTISEPGAPVAETTAATSVEPASATLNGKVNPEGKETHCKFEYGTGLPSGKFQACETVPGNGTAPVAVAAKVTGLTGGTTYKFKLIAENAEKKVGEGSPLSFTTSEPAAAPSAETLAPASVSQTGAIVKGAVNPHGAETTCKFEYGTTTGYGNAIACPTAPGKGRSNVEEAVTIGGLAAGTAYHYRIVAESTLGKAFGGDRPFTTASPPPPHEEGTPSGPPNTNTTPKIEVHPYATPTVTIASNSLAVAASGAFTVKLSCPGAASQCAGTITLKTLTAVAAHSARAAKKAILTLATGSFTITGGASKVVTLHLSAKAKKLLAKLHVVRARITIAAKNPQGATHTTTAVVTLKPAKKKH